MKSVCRKKQLLCIFCKKFMIHYRMENVEVLVNELKRERVTITYGFESVSYGKFVHIMNIEENKTELWVPNDIDMKSPV